MKHVIITGGAGFIGSHLCDRFLSAGYAVTAVDNLITGRAGNLARASKDPGFELVELNVSRGIPESRLRLAARHGVHGVLHFACPASPVDFARLPFEILEAGSVGTMHTVDLALRHKARYVLASTSEVYGDPLVHPQAEDYRGNVNPSGPRACYDEAKRFAEAYVSTSVRHRGLDAAIARIFNTYGPRVRPEDGRVVPEFIASALRGEDLPVSGDGTQTRSFCYVSDLVEGVFRLFESTHLETVNLGNPEERSVLELARDIIRETGSASAIRYVSARPEDPRRRRPRIEKARRLLGWEPRVSLAEGLRETIAYFRELESAGMAAEPAGLTRVRPRAPSIGAFNGS